MTSVVSSRAKKPQQKNAPNPPGHITAHWQGPLPPPEAVQRFDAIVPNGAERVFRMAELEQQHRIETERAVLDQNIKASQAEIDSARLGLKFGTAISALSIAASVGSAVIGAHWSVSVALVGVPLMGTVKAIIRRK